MFQYKIDEDLSLKLNDYQDSEEFYNLIEASREHLKEWMTWVDAIKDQNDVEINIQRNLLKFANKKGMHFLILYKSKIVGSIGLKEFSWDIKSAEIGYWISPEFQGKGIITKAVKAVLIYGFDTVGLNKIEIWAAEKNTKSRNVPERLGFVQEGIRRNNEIIDGKYHNMVIYGLLKSEWEKQEDRHDLN